MALPDTNILLALQVPNHVFHVAADAWFAEQTAGSVYLCRSTQQSLMRLLTTESVLRLYGQPALTNERAWELQDSLLRNPRVTWTQEPAQLETQWRKFTSRNTASPKIWMDAYLAAFAITCNTPLVTADKGFAQFEGLDCHILSLATNT